MNNFPIIEIAHLKKGVRATDYFEDLLFIADFNKNNVRGTDSYRKAWPPLRLNALSFLLVEEGEGIISIDYVSYKLTANTILIIMPVHIIQEVESSPNFKGKFLVSDISFLDEYKHDNMIVSLSNLIQIRKNPIINLIEEESQYLDSCIEDIREKLNQKHYFLHKEVLQVAYISFLLEYSNLLMKKKEDMVIQKISRREEILNDFLKLLLENCKEQRIVTFYADKLFITSQYLSLVLKDLTGKTANEWINEAVLLEAKILLRSPNITVQLVADTLNFADQSTFGKFFKKHTGISPMEYRKGVVTYS